MKNNTEQIKSCCSPNMADANKNLRNEHWITGYKDTAVGKIPVISTNLVAKDIFGGWMVRWDISRDNYMITPGIYCIGNPSGESPVLVTANYKLTFDKLRKELTGVDAWIMVLDTKGINVWCAAGKGTFGTDELIIRIKVTNLDKIVNHKKIILPQLGAPGVSAHIVKQETGFGVEYGPVYAKDIKEYISNSFKKTNEMRAVHFKLIDRLAVIPVELVATFKYLVIALIIFGIISAIENKMFGFNILRDIIPIAGAFFSGVVLAPILLPFIPFRSFALKGLFLGILWAVVINIIFDYSLLLTISHFLIVPAVSAFMAMNYTGASTYTSPTGAKLEVRYAFVPVIIAVASGLVLSCVNIFV